MLPINNNMSSASSTQPAAITRLPNVLWAHTAQFLQIDEGCLLMRVCKLFRNNNEMAIKVFDLHGEKGKFVNQKIQEKLDQGQSISIEGAMLHENSILRKNERVRNSLKAIDVTFPESYLEEGGVIMISADTHVQLENGRTIEKVLQTFMRLQTVKLNGVDFIPYDLKALPGLTELNTFCCTQGINPSAYKSEQLANIAQIPNLRVLDLTGFPETLGYANLFQRCTKLTRFGLSHGFPYDVEQNLACVRKMPDLEYFEICATQEISTESLEHLAACTKLQELNLTFMSIPEQGFEVLSRMRLKKLVMGGDQPVSEEARAYLPRLDSVQELTLSRCENEFLEQVSLLPNLEVLRLQGFNVKDDSMVHIKKCHKLKKVDLTGTYEVSEKAANDLRRERNIEVIHSHKDA